MFWPGPNNSWSDLLRLCRHAEATGWDRIYFADHFMPNAADNSGPTAECWTTLAALAASVPRVKLGALVTGNTYRHPAVLAKMAANVDIISGGRCILGLGAGWQENEHTAYGIPFYTLGGRMRRFEEACQVVTGLLNNERTEFAGRYYQLKDAPLAPKPVQSPLPLLIGGGGEKQTLRIAATYANEWNVWGTPEVLRDKQAILDAHCSDVGRNPRDIQRGANALLVLTDDADAAQNARVPGRPMIAGNAAEVRSIVQKYIDAGVDELVIPDFNLGRGPDQKEANMDRFMNDVVAAFR